MKARFLAPTAYSNSQDYFGEFFAINKVRNSKFSYRSFAEEIGWPTSYLPDLVSGRKKLSIQRALQFAEYFKMNNVNKDHILWLAVHRSPRGSTETAEAFNLRTNPNHLLYKTNEPHDSFLLYDTIWVSRLLIWKKKKMTAEQILNEFEISSVPEKRIQNALESIERQKIITWNPNGTLKEKAPEMPGEFDHANTKGDKLFEGLNLHKESTLNFLRFIDAPQAPSTYHTRIVAIPKEQFIPVAMKLIDLRNWIDELSRQHLNESSEPEKTSHLMQLDINLFPIRKKKPL